MNVSPHRVAVVTGSRAEFGLLEGILGGLQEAPWCELNLVVAGMHLDPRLGSTERQVIARFRVAARVPMLPPEDTRRGMALGVGDGLKGFVEAYGQLETAR